MAHNVKCLYCGITFDRDKHTDCVAVSARRYAHLQCHLENASQKTQEEKDREALEEYIKKLFNVSSISARVRKQIKDFQAEYKYTYSGMLKSLTYFFEVKGNDIEKANGGIGIIPYVYQQAYNYYYSIWVAQQTNDAKPIEQLQTVERVITIPPPQRQDKRVKKLFSFLDEEEE